MIQQAAAQPNTAILQQTIAHQPHYVMIPPEAFCDALIRLGLSDVAKNEFINNGLTNLSKL